ncbi:hypothetical protein AABB24_005235 [Solanum stoloniferum]|uniref:Uncharacterized protein n=2 Tax=Solanum TaxID=4107 RepID=A0AAF0QBT4_SOLVR|nr:uncharacterized protein LOC125828369 [Solanum verrucosum]WMV19325.1 hypothetical protein MTR67_012710 [Solanum verrucosum]
MVCPSQPKTSLKSSSTSLNSMKLKSLVQSFIFSHVYRAIAKAKSLLIQIMKNVQLVHQNKKKNNVKLFLGSFRLHYNWCSSHVMPVPVPTAFDVYYDSTWNSIISTACDESELSGYLQWLEDKDNSNNDIDKLADMFIANSHERFRLEKVESYRRFQEMLARSV